VKELKSGYDAEAMTDIIERELPLITQRATAITREEIRASLSARNFVAVRRIPGGPASEALDPEILRAKEQLAADERWLLDTESRRANARIMMRQESDALLERNHGN
jgi:argininosuccinate lyase